MTRIYSLRKVCEVVYHLYMDGLSTIRQSQQSSRQRLQSPRQRLQSRQSHHLHPVSRCEQPIRMGDVTTSTHGRIRVGGSTERTNDTRSSRQNRQEINTRSRSRVSIKLTPQTQCLFASARTSGSSQRTIKETYFRIFIGVNRMK